MTAIALYVERLYCKAIKYPNRLAVTVILLVAIFVAGFVLVLSSVPPAVRYNGGDVPVIAPLSMEPVCPGDVIHYPLVTEIKEREIPGRVEIDEAWCQAGLAGPCKSATPPNPRVPLLEPKRIVSEAAARTVPLTLTPGTWHFWHTATDSHGQVNGYIVAPVVVKDCDTP